MAYNLATTELSTIFMSVDDPLGSETLSKKFRILLENDKIINQLFSNSIGIWQCSWYYDSSVRGYNLGDAVWINTEDINTFVKSRAEIIKTYTDLNSQVLTKLPDFDEKDDDVVEKYKNAMSGYTDVNLGKDVVLPPIFDIGDFSKPIQLAISLKNNNKGLLSDDLSWKKLFVNSDEDEENIRHIIDSKEEKTLTEHLLNYHLSGKEDAVRAKLSDYLDSQDNFNYTNLSNEWYSRYNENSSKPNYGVDYVLYSIRKPIVSNGAVSQYQGVRYWKSGMIEHFGTIATGNSMFFNKDTNEIVIPFDWKIIDSESGAKVYESGELGSSFNTIISANETDSNMVPPKDNYINVMFEKSSITIHSSDRAYNFKNNNYKISITAVYQDQSGISENYIPISYGEEDFVQKWHSNYLSDEAKYAKNHFSFKAGTRVVPPYISYYAIGMGDF